MKHSIILLYLFLSLFSNAQLDKQYIASISPIEKKTTVLGYHIESFKQLTISGTVVDDFSDLPIENAKIKVKNFNLGAFSDVNGHFTITMDQEYPIVLITS